MSHYHDLARPMEKEAMPLLRTAGRHLATKGLWSAAARGGERLAARGGKLGMLGQATAAGAGAMRKASPYMLGYGMAGMFTDLPGSNLALGLGSPVWGALTAAPGAIRSARLAGGGHNDAIKQDAISGARLAGTDWIEATQRDGSAAYDPASYQRMLQENRVPTAGADRYLSEEQLRQPNWWQRLGNVFENPTGNVTPVVQQGIYDQLHKKSSFEDELEKEAFARGALNLVRSGWGAGKAGLRAGKAGWQSINPTARKWGGRAVGTAFAAPMVLDAYSAFTEDKPYDAQAIQQEGYDGAQAAIRDRLAKMTPWERRFAKLDPSLAVQGLEEKLPGAIAGWEQQQGRAYQPGMLSNMRQAWNGRGKPEFYSYDGAGNANYL